MATAKSKIIDLVTVLAGTALLSFGLWERHREHYKTHVWHYTMSMSPRNIHGQSIYDVWTTNEWSTNISATFTWSSTGQVVLVYSNITRIKY